MQQEYIVASIKVLAAVGAVTTLFTLRGLFGFTRNYFRRSSLPRYLHGKDTWALVTGASDGIGKAFATQLAEHGFNVILHGRNASKLETFAQQLRPKHPQQQFQTYVLDASTATSTEIEQLATSLSSLNLTVLINNVGGSAGPKTTFSYFLSQSVSEVQQANFLNASFNIMLTRALLPTLIANQPSLTLSIGSGVDTWPQPHNEAYTGAKACTRQFCKSLRYTMALLKHDVEVLYVRNPGVATSPTGFEPSLFIPAPETHVRACLARVGCPAGETAGLRRIAVLHWVFDFIPDAILAKITSGIVEQIIETKAKQK